KVAEGYQAAVADGLAAPHVTCQPTLDGVPWHEQVDLPVHVATGPALAQAELGVAPSGRDLMTEEPGTLVRGVGYQCLLFRQLQLHPVAADVSDSALDLLGFRFRPDEPQQKVIRVPNVSQPAKVWVTHVLRRQRVLKSSQPKVLVRVQILAFSSDR